MNFFPENRTTCFTTHLSREIRLRGEWSVALAEIHIPCTMVHVRTSEAFHIFKFIGDKVEIAEFAPGVYESVAQLAEAINEAGESKNHHKLVPCPNRKGWWMIKRVCECEESHLSDYSAKLRKIFGFEGVPLFTTDTEKEVEGARPASLARAIPDQLFVYTDICEVYNVGDTQAALLRICNLQMSKYKFGTNVVKQFAPLHYIPLIATTFSQVTLDIRCDQGKAIPFEYGTLTATLHFKRVR